MSNIFKEKKPIIVFISTFLMVFSALFTFYKFYEQNEDKKNSEKANLLMLNIVNEIQLKISQGTTVVDSQILLLKQNNYDTKNFNYWAKDLIHGKDALACIQIAKDGIVSDIYPYEENKILYNYRIFQ